MTSPRLRAGAAGVILSLLAVGLPAGSAHAEEVISRPDASGLALTGHGYGHGRGMSQWGANGAAQVGGLNFGQILDFYYPGTTRQSLSDETIRVALSDADGDTVIAPTDGLRVVSGGVATPLPVGAGYTRWRVTGGGSPRLEYADAAGAWRGYPPAGGALAADVVFAATSGVMRVLLPTNVWEEVRGEVHAVSVSGATRTVLHTPMETYLRGVVPNEMPASWHGQALAAQSVAARTYAAAYRQRQRAAGSWYDICDSTSCQVFSGAAQISGGNRVPKEDARTDGAIRATSGVVLRAGSSSSAPLINAEFSSANGGWTAAGSAAYQVAKPDPYDGMVKNSSNTWSTTVSTATLDAAGVGRFRRMVVLRRDGNGDFGGRILTARLEGDGGTRQVTGDQLRWIFGVKSDWFRALAAPREFANRDWSGDGVADVLARDPNGDLMLYAGTGGSFGAGKRVGVGWGAMVDLFAAGDFDGTGGQDVIARHADGRLFFYAGNGGGGWTRQAEIGHGWGGFFAFASPGDWDGDGRPDVIAINRATQALVLSAGNGAVLMNPVGIGTGWGAMTRLFTPGDFDGDGQPDIIALSRGGDLYLYSGDGAGHIVRQRQIGWGWSGMSAVWSPGDVDGDKKSDLLGIDASGTLWLYPGRGDGGFGAARALGTGWAGRTPVG